MQKVFFFFLFFFRFVLSVDRWLLLLLCSLKWSRKQEACRIKVRPEIFLPRVELPRGDNETKSLSNLEANKLFFLPVNSFNSFALVYTQVHFIVDITSFRPRHLSFLALLHIYIASGNANPCSGDVGRDGRGGEVGELLSLLRLLTTTKRRSPVPDLLFT